MINAALSGELDKAEYIKEPVFGVEVPTHVPNVPDEVLNPRNTLGGQGRLRCAEFKLAGEFVKNFQQLGERADAGQHCCRHAQPQRIGQTSNLPCPLANHTKRGFQLWKPRFSLK